ncbi:hypothetical protein KGF56_001549 [Candida oxycetoniae]|uniref:SRPBCC domain-containing protein n=1 Tax=Candida oxycetoniae TaxID=497107 RepID=A0AAI9WYM8_9ASCO|nr:uncharacterized protein KGF56_001549 [Candida oxycetoniae]KAI3405531.2 hypothetical protein KGF56_001549 [Candida oxycetoniae]
MPSIQTHIIINASPEEVRQVLFDYKSFFSWNPFMTHFQKFTNQETSELEVGDELQIDLKLKGTNHTSTIYPKILEKSDDKLVWQGNLIHPWIFYGTHSFDISLLESAEDSSETGGGEASGGEKTVFGQSEVFGGLLVYFLQILGVFRKTQESFKEFNEALKDQVEKKKKKKKQITKGNLTT